jgi:MFS family permease
MSNRVRLQRAQWLVLTAAFLGWLFDGFEIGVFPVAGRPALQSLLPGANDMLIGQWMGYITAAFLLGAACGGLVFGWLGDRSGRVKAMSASILTYAIFTGLTYFSQNAYQLAIFRFVAALGMGGEWSLGVALVMECWPEKWRPLLAGSIGAAANVGILLAGSIAKQWPVTIHSWRWIFVVGASPALLVFLIRLFVPESEKWKSVSLSGPIRPVREVFTPPLLKHTLLGVVFASVALIGTWGSVQWIPFWVDKLTGGNLPRAKAVAHMASAYGAILGSLAGPLAGGKIGRRPAFFGLCLASLLTCQYLFRHFTQYSSGMVAVIFWAGFFTAAFYGWFPLYLPELFPTRVRATGQGVSYNTGRVFAAVGAVIGGQLVLHFHGSYAKMGGVITLIYLVGMIAIWFAPETRGRPLPD